MSAQPVARSSVELQLWGRQRFLQTDARRTRGGCTAAQAVDAASSSRSVRCAPQSSISAD